MKRFKRKQSGVTLLELMVSLGIGAILLTGLGVVYVTATQEDTLRTLRSELDEAARQIFSTMARDIHLAGFIDNFDGTTVTGAAGNTYGNKILVRSDNIKNLFNREDNEVTALSLLTGKKYMLPIQGDDKHITIIYQVENSENNNLNDKDYRSLSGAMSHSQSDAKNAIGSGWGKNCINETDAARIDYDGKKDENGLFLKQDFVFNETNKNFSCGMAAWNDNWRTTNNKYVDSNDDTPTLTNDLKAMVGNSKANTNPTSVESMKFRYVVTDNKYGNTNGDDYTVAESIAGYYTDKVFNYDQVKKSQLGWGGVTGVEVCMVLAVSPTFSKKGKNTLATDLSAMQPDIPTCNRTSDDVVDVNVDVSGAQFEKDNPRPANDSKYYVRYVRTLSAHNALYLR